MQGLVTLDFGNTNPHGGLFRKGPEGWTLIKTVPWAQLPAALEENNFRSDNSQLVLSEVRAREEELFPLLKQGFLLTRVKDYWRGDRFAGMPVNYARTLGEDRLIGAWSCFKNSRVPTLLIDAGTFVTVDLITERGLEGGYILPGTKAYFSTFAAGERLKDISLSTDLGSELPHDTVAAMRDGYRAFGALALSLANTHNVQRVVLTGGDATLWESFFKDTNLTVQTEPHLIHVALKHWMTTQIEPL